MGSRFLADCRNRTVAISLIAVCDGGHGQRDINGYDPLGNVSLGQEGNLYGTADEGGILDVCGGAYAGIANELSGSAM
jgi:hypothetical protein